MTKVRTILLILLLSAMSVGLAHATQYSNNMNVAKVVYDDTAQTFTFTAALDTSVPMTYCQNVAPNGTCLGQWVTVYHTGTIDFSAKNLRTGQSVSFYQTKYGGPITMSLVIGGMAGDVFLVKENETIYCPAVNQNVVNINYQTLYWEWAYTKVVPHLARATTAFTTMSHGSMPVCMTYGTIAQHTQHPRTMITPAGVVSTIPYGPNGTHLTSASVGPDTNPGPVRIPWQRVGMPNHS